MIQRGTSHVIFEKLEIMKKIRQPHTIKLLEELMWVFEEYSRRSLLIETGAEVTWTNEPEFKRLMELTRKWLQAPIRINFSNRPISDKKERRRLRRLRRKNHG